MSFNLRLTEAGRGALADGRHRATTAVQFTEMHIGKGLGPGGADDDARTALRDPTETAALGGSTRVAGRIALRADFTPTSDFAVTEVGLVGRVGDGAKFLAAYWATPSTDGAIAGAVEGTRLAIVAALEIVASAAELTITVNDAIALGAAPAVAMYKSEVNGGVHDVAIPTRPVLWVVHTYAPGGGGAGAGQGASGGGDGGNVELTGTNDAGESVRLVVKGGSGAPGPGVSRHAEPLAATPVYTGGLTSGSVYGTGATGGFGAVEAGLRRPCGSPGGRHISFFHPAPGSTVRIAIGAPGAPGAGRYRGGEGGLGRVFVTEYHR